MNRLLTVYSILAALQISFLPAVASVEEVIAMARQRLGGEEVLNSVNSIHFKGKFMATNRGTEGQIEILFQKPFQQRLDVSEGDSILTTGLNGYEGWNRRISINNPGSWDLEILDAADVRRMRANTHDNLNFFTGLDKVRGKVLEKAVQKKDGRDAHVLVFQYDDKIFYKRYFDVQTGELISTVNDQGLEIKEVGQMVVDGVRFPQKVVSLIDGEIVNTVEFTEIILNEDLDSSYFDLPDFAPHPNKPIVEEQP